MIVVTCDACGAECPTSHNVVEIPVHLYSLRDEVGYVDSEMNRVSGRHDILHLCNKCNNRAQNKMVEEIIDIQNNRRRSIS